MLEKTGEKKIMSSATHTLSTLPRLFAGRQDEHHTFWDRPAASVRKREPGIR